MNKNTPFADISRDSLDRSDQVVYRAQSIQGLSEEVIRQISSANNEPDWMLDFRLGSLRTFHELEFPKWGPSLEGLNLEEIYYF